MRKAYIIIAHKNPQQVHRLISRLNDGNSEFFLHIDKKVDFEQFKILSSFGDALYFLERFDSRWGSYGTIKPYLNALEEIRQSQKPFDRILLISGQDYPIKSNQAIDEFFEKSAHSVFIDYFPIPDYEKWPGSDRGGLYRVDKYYFGGKWYELLGSKTLNFLSQYLPFLRRTLPNGMKPYTGQTWWTLDMYAVNYILDYVELHPEYLEFHRNTFVADELFVQMIIGNSTDQRLLDSIENSEKRFTIWEHSTSAHPKILNDTDFEAIAASADLFARKFDDKINSTILDMIDEQILEKY